MMTAVPASDPVSRGAGGCEGLHVRTLGILCTPLRAHAAAALVRAIAPIYTLITTLITTTKQAPAVG